MDVDAYLERIGLTRPARPSLEALVAIHEAHMQTVPFENLDIPLGRVIECDLDRFLDKIVRQRRGGFCYELNGAFQWLLRELGFDVSFLAAQVFDERGIPGPEYDHMLLHVDLDGEPWIADVGFGDSFRRPLRLVDGLDQEDGDPRGGSYRFDLEGEMWTMFRRIPGADDAQYRFALVPHELGEYAGMCLVQQTSPESSFTRRVVCSHATARGRLTLTADRLIETTAEGRTETPVARDEWYDVLRESFGIELPGLITRWPA